MILIPTWVLLLEIGILEGVLLVVYLRNKTRTIGRIAGVLLLPFAYVFATYAAIDYLPIESARIVSRYALSMMFFVLILIFGQAIIGRKK